MKSFGIYVVISLIIGLSLAACQSTTNNTHCEPTSSPFATPPTNDPNDVRVMYAPNVTIGKVCTFSGQVRRAQTYKHEIVDGLVFCLLPNSGWHENEGWNIIISDTMDDDCSKGFNGIVSPPFHGMNPIFIAGWHFRNDTNTAENDGSVNAPQEVRWFNFLFDTDAFEAVWSAHSCLSWFQCEENGLTQDEAVKIIATTPKSRGIMTISNLELGNLVPNDKAWIETMEFEVKIYLPTE